MNWNKRKVIVFESDDWGGLEHGIPNMQTQRRLAKHPDIIRAVNTTESKKLRFYTIMDTLESVEDLDALFKLLLHFRGGDGRPAVFTPIYLLASLDFRAIKANGFTKYVDIGIDKPYPAIFRRCGDITAKAREGLRLGVWVPESHNTRMTAHIDPHKWVRLLREKKDKAFNVFFRYNMIGYPSDIPRMDFGWEFDSMGIKELRAWVATGTRYFRNAFGYAPRVTGLADARARCKALVEIMEEIMVENGVKVILNARNKQMGEYNRKLGLTYIQRNVDFEPLVFSDAVKAYSTSYTTQARKQNWRAAYRGIMRAWANNQPAIINTHRMRYVSMDPAQKAQALRQLECLLDIIRRKHPEAVYRSSHELGQMYRRNCRLQGRGEIGKKA